MEPEIVNERHCERCDWLLAPDDGLRCVICVSLLKNIRYRCGVCQESCTYGTIPKKPIRCEIHKLSDDYNVLKTYCEGPNNSGCPTKTGPTFIKPGDTKPTRCAKCIPKEEKHLWTTNRRVCQECKKVSPSFGYGKTPTHCASCRTKLGLDMPNLTAKKCQSTDCPTVATFGYRGKNVVYCSKHAVKDMYNQRKKVCIYPNCDKSASIAKDKDSLPEYCAKHKPSETATNKKVKCACGKIAHYGYNEFISCGSCKKSDMTDLTKYVCEFVDQLIGRCDKYATRGYTDTNKLTRCHYHAVDGMISLANRRCIESECHALAGFGQLFRSRIHCKQHKTNNEYSNNYPHCKCGERAYYGLAGKLPIHCNVHKTELEINHVEAVCDTCKCAYDKRPDKTICEYCETHASSNRIHKKELEIQAVLDKAGIKHDHDRKIPNGCSLYRPDFVIDKGTFTIIVECDEKQHKHYQATCERNRMLQLFQDNGGIPIQFIRYNPDEYTSSGTTVKPSTKRLTILIEEIKKVLSWEAAPYLVGAIYLYYDEFNINHIVNVDQKYDEAFEVDKLMIVAQESIDVIQQDYLEEL